MGEPSEMEQLLGFAPAWRALGVIDDVKLDVFREEWDRNEDANLEHYRWRAFNDFLHACRPVPPALASSLYALGEADPDAGAGGAMMSAVVWLAECPEEVLARATASGRRHLVRAVSQRMASGGVPIRRGSGQQ